MANDGREDARADSREVQAPSPDVTRPPVVDVEDWPPMSRTDAARAELDRQVGTLGVGAGLDAEGPESSSGRIAAGDEEQPEAWAEGTPTADEELGTGVMGRGEDLLTKGETHGRADDPGLSIEDGGRGPRRG